MRAIPYSLFFGLLLPRITLAQIPTPAEKANTVAWIRSLQTTEGGFSSDKQPGSPATLAATEHALQALKFFGAPRGPDELLYDAGRFDWLRFAAKDADKHAPKERIA